MGSKDHSRDIIHKAAVVSPFIKSFAGWRICTPSPARFPLMQPLKSIMRLGLSNWMSWVLQVAECRMLNILDAVQ